MLSSLCTEGGSIQPVRDLSGATLNAKANLLEYLFSFSFPISVPARLGGLQKKKLLSLALTLPETL